MGIPREPKHAKYFVALLFPREDLVPYAENELTRLLGAVEFRSEILPWNLSRYYEAEMGSGLRRAFLSFAPLLSPGRLSEIKLQTQEVEERYRCGGWRRGRRMNIDPGYLEAGKVVLASTKNASHRIYLESGIYGETTLLYYDGAFQACRHTYPDYVWPETLAFFSRLRARYLDQLKEGERPARG